MEINLTLKNGPLVVVQILLLVLLGIIVMTTRLVPIIDKNWTYSASIFLLLLFMWILWSWEKASDSLFDPYVLFIIAAMMFNGGQVLLEVFHLNESGILGGEVPSETMIKTLFLVILSMTSLHLGGLLSASFASNKDPRQMQFKSPIETQKELRLVGWVLLIISTGPAIIILVDSAHTVMSYGYFALYQKDVSTGFGAAPMIIGTFLVPSSLFLLAGSKEQRGGILVSSIVVFAFSLFQLFLGYRSYAAMNLIAFAWLWHQCIRPIPKIVIWLAGILIFAGLFPLIGVIRKISGDERTSLGYLVETFLSIENPIIEIIKEMGGSMGTIAYTIDLVPSTRGYEMGVGYLYGISTILPNFFWDIHPAIAHGTPSNWMVWTVNPEFAKVGGGLGYSFIAEAYLNFGWYGAPIMTGILGYLIGKLTICVNKSGDLAKKALAASFLAFFLHYARGEFSEIVRPLLWYSVFPFFMVLFFRKIEKSKYRTACMES